MLQLPATPADPAIRDTIAAVFRAPGYSRTIRQTLLDRFFAWLGQLFRGLRLDLGDATGLQWVALALFALIIGGVVGRAAWLACTGRVARAAARDPRRRAAWGDGAGDPWREAGELAAAGRYTDAAHALYAAILLALSRRERVRLHPSKTVGDYTRELRRRSSALLPRYREFARLYEVVVFGLGECDRARFERLASLAAEIVDA